MIKKDICNKFWLQQELYQFKSDKNKIILKICFCQKKISYQVSRPFLKQPLNTHHRNRHSHLQSCRYHYRNHCLINCSLWYLYNDYYRYHFHMRMKYSCLMNLSNYLKSSTRLQHRLWLLQFSYPLLQYLLSCQCSLG